MRDHNRPGPIIEIPGSADVAALTDLFEADVRALGLPVNREALRAAAADLVANVTSRVYMRVARPGPGQPAAGVIVAHAWTSVKFAGPAYWIETLYVDDRLRRTGMGRRLVAGLIDHAGSVGVNGIDLEAYRMNAPASYLYRSLGFRRLGRERYSYRLPGPDDDPDV